MPLTVVNSQVEVINRNVKVRFTAGSQVQWKHGRVIYYDADGLVHVKLDDGSTTVKPRSEVRLIEEESE